MRKRNTIVKAYTRRYTDSGQLTAYVEWSDGSRTEGPATDLVPRRKPGDPLHHPEGGTVGRTVPDGLHMQALFARALREGLTITHEEW